MVSNFAVHSNICMKFSKEPGAESHLLESRFGCDLKSGGVFGLLSVLTLRVFRLRCYDPEGETFSLCNSWKQRDYHLHCAMHSTFCLSNLSEFDDIDWAPDECFFSSPRKEKNLLFDLFFTRFGKTSRRAARAVRDFVTCSSPQSSGFLSTEEATSQESPAEIQDSLEEDGSFKKEGAATPSQKPDPHWKPSHDRGDLWTRGAAEVTSTSSCEPKLPSNFFELPSRQRLRAVKQFLGGFVYKPNAEPSLQANKQRPLCRLMATARRIVYKPESIKSVEAVFLALYLTAGLVSVDRIPVGFKTKFANEVSQHTVVVVQHNDKFGAFGISPNPDLMTKDLQFDSMSSIIENYVKAYEASGHSVLKIWIGLQVEHDVISSHFICWQHLCLSPDSKTWAECVVDIENHMLRMRHLWDLWILTGKGHDPRKAAPLPKKPDSARSTIAPRRSKPTEPKPPKKHQPEPPPQRNWDTESTGSNADDQPCEHCERLRRAMPPVDTKRASVTTVQKPGRRHDHVKFRPKNKIPGQRFRSEKPEEWEAESLGSSTGVQADRRPSIKRMLTQV